MSNGEATHGSRNRSTTEQAANTRWYRPIQADYRRLDIATRQDRGISDALLQRVEDASRFPGPGCRGLFFGQEYYLWGFHSENFREDEEPVWLFQLTNQRGDDIEQHGFIVDARDSVVVLSILEREEPTAHDILTRVGGRSYRWRDCRDETDRSAQGTGPCDPAHAAVCPMCRHPLPVHRLLP